MSFFPLGSNIVINGGSFVQHNSATRELSPLYDNVSPNAILNAGGRADSVRCHPGTREEVIEKMEKHIIENDSASRGVFWLSGPAGSGKSAIMQTIAERCIERKVPMANFFFFRADSTRNHSGPVVATLLFQFFNLFPSLKAHVEAIVSQNPVIFRQSMQQQFSTLIETPLEVIRPSTEKKPLVILIDGLDECSSGNGKEDQVSLLHILHNITPAVIILVASRTEAHITMAFNEIGYHSGSIYLDESYRPSDDIRVLLNQELSRIKRMHRLKDTLPESWPSSTDIDVILDRSSGQFVFASTAIRFIANSAVSPKRSLEIVLGLRPATRTSPFAALDSLYMYILSQAEDWSSVHDILAASKIVNLWTWNASAVSLTFLLSPLDCTEDDILSSLSDLTAIIQFCSGDKNLTVYHATLNDFLYDPHRAGQFYVDINAFGCRLAPPHFKCAADRNGLNRCFRILECVRQPDKQLTSFLTSFLPDPRLFRHKVFMFNHQQHWMSIFARFYQSCDSELHEEIVNRWQEWFIIVMNSSET